MNPNLDRLHPYPFQRLDALLQGVKTAPDLPLISWAMGEPAHKAPRFLVDALRDERLIRRGYGGYPPTRGIPELRRAIADFIRRRFRLATGPDPESQVLPVSGTREALFAFAQTIVAGRPGAVTAMPNPFYQIYEGAALLAGSEPCYLDCTGDNGFMPDMEAIPDDVWRRCALLYLCTPGNPTGAVMSTAQLRHIIGLADEYGFVIASDECYSEIYTDEASPPPGLLQAASEMGRDDFKNCMTFNSLSKRSSLPGLRSGYVAGDARLIDRFLLYRTYQGSAMPYHHQYLSMLAWRDEQHVIDNRAVYRDKLAAVVDILAPVWPMARPEATFYLWPETPVPDTAFATRLVELAGVKVLPGSFIARHTPAGCPGEGRVRLALVATGAECREAATRIVDCWNRL